MIEQPSTRTDHVSETVENPISDPALTSQERTSTRIGFWVRLALFALPFLIPVLLLTGLLVYIGESMPLASVVALQQGETPVLYRPQFGNRDLSFKTLSINVRRPQIVALGSSRVLQMRSGLLTEAPSAFYNAGAPAWKLEQIRALLDGLEPHAAPEILLLGIDAPWFNERYEGDSFPPQTNDFTHLFSINRSFVQAVLDGKPIRMDKWLSRNADETPGVALGLKAIENGHGFRNDGSEQYGDFLIGRFLWQPTERERHLEWMRNGEDMYVYGDTVSRSALDEMRVILDHSRERGITVVGFMPPFTPTLYAEMMARGNHTYIPTLVNQLDSLFSVYDYPFFDFSDGGQFGTDEDFYDGWHGSERIYLRLFINMARAQPDQFSRYTDVDTLSSIDAAAGDTWRVFGP
jgi:hypothetical protein